MSQETNIQNESTTQTAEAENKSEVVSDVITPEEYRSLQANYKSVAASRDKIKQRVRELEDIVESSLDTNSKLEKLAADLEAKTNELNSFKEGLKQEKLGTALSTALEAAGARDPKTALKLIDKTKVQFDEEGKVVADSVIAAITELQDSDPILFGEVDPKKAAQSGQGNLDPGVLRAGNKKVDDAFQTELRAARTKPEWEAVMKKYGRPY
jgi:vacuolar-type H+-ATPase subunit I/STV1